MHCWINVILWLFHKKVTCRTQFAIKNMIDCKERDISGVTKRKIINRPENFAFSRSFSPNINYSIRGFPLSFVRFPDGLQLSDSFHTSPGTYVNARIKNPGTSAGRRGLLSRPTMRRKLDWPPFMTLQLNGAWSRAYESGANPGVSGGLGVRFHLWPLLRVYLWCMSE